MAKVVKIVWLLCTIVLCSNTYAADKHVYINYGIGVASPNQGSPADIQTVQVGIQNKVLGVFSHKWELGYYVDKLSGYGHKSSLFGFYSWGIRVNTPNFYVQSFWGVGGIGTGDTVLGSGFQFTQDLGLGIVDKDGTGIGINYKHISSAGFNNPNTGRDFITVHWEFKF